MCDRDGELDDDGGDAVFGHLLCLVSISAMRLIDFHRRWLRARIDDLDAHVGDESLINPQHVIELRGAQPLDRGLGQLQRPVIVNDGFVIASDRRLTANSAGVLLTGCKP